MIQHQLQNGKTLLFVEVENNWKDFRVFNENSHTRLMINKSYFIDDIEFPNFSFINLNLNQIINWQLLGDSRKITEEQAMEFMEPICISRSKPNLYVYPDFTDNIKEKNTALEAFKSLKQMLGVVDVNPYGESKPKFTFSENELNDSQLENAQDDFDFHSIKWHKAQQQVKRYVVLIKLD